MGDSVRRGKRLLRPQAVEQVELRDALIGHMRDTRSYRARIGWDALPCWRAIPPDLRLRPAEPSHNPSDADRALPFAVLEQLTGEATCPPEVRAYLDMLNRIVADLGLYDGGQPARWAAAYVHADATSGSFGPHDPGGGGPIPSSSVTLRIEVSAGGAEIRLVNEVQVLDVDGERREDRNVLPPRRVNAARFLGFDEWDTLEREAHALISAWVADKRKAWRSYKPEGRSLYRNSGTPEAQAEYVRVLYEYLANDVPVDHGQQPTIKDVAVIIGVDFPKPAEK